MILVEVVHPGSMGRMGTQDDHGAVQRITQVASSTAIMASLSSLLPEPDLQGKIIKHY